MSSKKVFWVGFGFLKFLTTRNDRIFLFPTVLQETYTGLNLCILTNYTRNHPKIAVSMSSKKSFLGRFRVLELLSTTRNDRIFLFPRVLKKTYVSIILCIVVDFTRENTKIWISMSWEKVFWVGFVFSNFFRLLETTEFFFFLRFSKRLISA